MTHFHRLIARFAALPVLPDLRAPFVLGVIAATATVPGATEAAARGGAYDGIWNVVFATTRGNCRSGYSVPFTVTGGRVSSAGGGRVNVSVGASHASGGGRLVGTYGAGSWRGIISGDRCSGTWQATRS